MNSEEKELNELKDNLGILAGINFSYVAQGGMVKNIAWGKEYKSWDIAKRLEFSEALASALNEAAEKMQDERNIALEEAVRLKEQLVNSQKNLDTILATNMTAITNFNKEKQDMAARIRELETQLSNCQANLTAFEITS